MTFWGTLGRNKGLNELQHDVISLSLQHGSLSLSHRWKTERERESERRTRLSISQTRRGNCFSCCTWGDFILPQKCRWATRYLFFFFHVRTKLNQMTTFQLVSNLYISSFTDPNKHPSLVMGDLSLSDVLNRHSEVSRAGFFLTVVLKKFKKCLHEVLLVVCPREG